MGMAKWPSRVPVVVGRELACYERWVLRTLHRCQSTRIRISGMAEELAFKDAAAAEYDRAFAHVTAHFMPFLLRAAQIAPGMRVLDIATGTGLSAKAALPGIGPTGQVTAADIAAARLAEDVPEDWARLLEIAHV